MSEERKLEYPYINRWKAFPSDRTDIIKGMTLLDYFAGQALASMTNGSPQKRADQAYLIAEAMMEMKFHTLEDKDDI